ncbi:MAG: hypothetical protein AAGP08_11805, partial [Pseudomonadota bacterium]
MAKRRDPVTVDRRLQAGRAAGQITIPRLSSWLGTESSPDAKRHPQAANHFLHAEDPHMVADLARELFVNGNANRPEDVFL